MSFPSSRDDCTFYSTSVLELIIYVARHILRMGQIFSCLRPSKKNPHRQPGRHRETCESECTVLNSLPQEPQAKGWNEKALRSEQQDVQRRDVDFPEFSATPHQSGPHQSDYSEIHVNKQPAVAYENNAPTKPSQHETLEAISADGQELGTKADCRDIKVMDMALMQGNDSPNISSKNRKMVSSGSESSSEINNSILVSKPSTSAFGTSNMRRICEEAPDDWQNFTQPTLDSIEGSLTGTEDNGMSEPSLGDKLQLRLPAIHQEDAIQKASVEAQSSLQDIYTIIARQKTSKHPTREGIQSFDDQNLEIRMGVQSEIASLPQARNKSGNYPSSPMTSPSLDPNSPFHNDRPPT